MHLTAPLPIVTLSLALAVLPSSLHGQGYPTTGDSASRADRTRTAASARRFKALAPRLVQSAAVKPGDLVTIGGGPALVPDMEALAVEVRKAGGFPVLILDSPRLTRALYTGEVPEQQLGRISPEWANFKSREVDVSFDLPSGEDVATLRRGDPARRTKVDQALARFQAATAAERDKGITRSLFISVPTPSDTASIQMDYGPYEAMQWSAIEADYGDMAKKGEQIKRTLEGAKKLHITSPEGTDFTVNLGPRPILVSAGPVPPGTKGSAAARSSSLPSGSVVFAPMETTANGKIRAAEDQCSKPVRDEVVDVRNGMPENVSSASDQECVQRSLKEAGRFGNITIGLNPNIKFEHIPSYAPQLQNAAGAVQIGFSPNQDLGGANPPAPGGWSVPLLKATVEADGKVIVKDGKLVF
ncbi:MAG TPA: aminopeptidase [Gemmatimonadales bacterium]|nr:aminopeptidase [Gemmatimonadales bacterium]